jgi:penicillin-binding protein 1A
MKPQNKRTKRTKNKNKPKRQFGKNLLKYLVIAGSWITTIGLILFFYFIHDLPDVSKIEKIEHIRKITFLANDDKVLATYGDLFEKPVKYSEIPQNLIAAIIATEDRRFFDHFGVDIFGLIRASWRNYNSGYIAQGGSTITQQLAKIVFLSSEKTIKRKVQELVLALYLEHKYSKKQILSSYINRAYMGSGIFGASAAAKYYFNKKLQNINIVEAAIIAGLLKAPSKYSPLNDATLSGERAYQVLLNMHDAGYLNNQQLTDAKNHIINIENKNIGHIENNYIVDYINENLDHFTESPQNLIIHTTIDYDLQKKISNIISNKINENIETLNIHQGAAIAIHSPSGAIKAMIGGASYASAPFNRAVKAQRQSGSTFKIFNYVSAFKVGFTPDSKMIDAPLKIGKWSPKNYSRNFLGEITLREAFAKSVNIIAVKLALETGMNYVIDTAYAMGIKSKLTNNIATSLGASEVNLLELTNSYATIASGGVHHQPFIIKKITTESGNIIYRNNNIIANRVINTQVADYTKDILKSVVEYGSGKKAAIEGKNIYGKTGTSQNYHDAWFIGFTDNITLGIWVGNDDNKPMRNVVGGTLPAIMWCEIMSK